MTWHVAVVADDLTGANDTAVQFAREGWPTLVALAPVSHDPETAAGVVAVTTDARAADLPEAAARTADAVRTVMASGVASLYLKIDSTMRGSVAGQVAGALEAWTGEHAGAFAVLCPAYPALGRTVSDGQALLVGRPLEEGAPGRDPVTPVSTSVLTELVPGAVHVAMPREGGAEALADALADAADGSSARVVTVDAGDDQALVRLADAVARLGHRVVPVGSAGLATALAARWRRPDSVSSRQSERRGRSGPAVVLVTSLNPVARQQEQRLLEEYGDRLVVLRPPLDVLLDDDKFASWSATRTPAGQDAAQLLLVSAPEERGTGAADVISDRLADVVVDLHRREPLSGVVVTGGDGARALVDRWGCVGIAVLDALREGMPRGVLVGGEADDLPIVTKAGGFGDADDLVHAVRHVVAEPSPSGFTR